MVMLSKLSMELKKFDNYVNCNIMVFVRSPKVTLSSFSVTLSDRDSASKGKGRLIKTR
jgi:hypothetical protein